MRWADLLCSLEAILFDITAKAMVRIRTDIGGTGVRHNTMQ